MPEVSAFFPFTSASSTDRANLSELVDILSTNHDHEFTEGSLFDGLSVSQGADWISLDMDAYRPVVAV